MSVREGEAEPMDVSVSAPNSVVRVGADMAVSPDQTAEIAAAVIGGVFRTGGKRPAAHQLAAQREMWALE